LIASGKRFNNNDHPFGDGFLLTYFNIIAILSVYLCKINAKNGDYMLISFKFSNYKSFKDTVEFSMEPLTNNGSISNAIETGYKKAPQVFRTSAIFGANASGKSSFIHAISYLQGLMEASYLKRFNEQMEVPAYKLSDTEKNSTFEFEFVKDKVAYKYFVELNNDGVVEEEAYYTELEEEKREKCLFKRTLTEFNSPYGLDKEIAKQTIKNRLLVSELVNNRNNQDKHILNIYNWIMDIDILCGDYEEILKDKRALSKSDLSKKVEFLRNADIPITKLIVNRDGLFSTHKNENGQEITFDFMLEESDGTQMLLCLSEDIFWVLENGSVLFMDELDKSLHPHLVKYLVGLFNNPETNPKGAQLIFTSHAHYLMDGETLTRDQIWFVAKDNGYSSELYSLSDFKQIKRKKGAFYNEYMYGIFGAVPNIKED